MQFSEGQDVRLKNYRSRSSFCGRSLSMGSLRDRQFFFVAALHAVCQYRHAVYRLAELKYAIFSRTGRNTKKLPCSKLFLWTVFKHGLLEGSKILLQYSAITRIPFKSSQLGELKYAI